MPGPYFLHDHDDTTFLGKDVVRYLPAQPKQLNKFSCIPWGLVQPKINKDCVQRPLES